MRPRFKGFLFGDFPAKHDDQIPTCVIFSSQSHVHDLLFTAFASVRALDRDGISQLHRAYQGKNSFPRGACGKIPRAHLEQLVLVITQQRAGSRVHINNPAIEVSDENGIRHMREQLFRQLQPSATSVEFAPNPLQFELQSLGRCLGTSDRIGAAVHGPFSPPMHRMVKFPPNFGYRSVGINICPLLGLASKSHPLGETTSRLRARESNPL
jgi:hypothetical protein